MPGVRDRDIVVLAPKEWRCTECATDTEHRTRYRLSLALRHDPVLDSRLFAGNGFRISRQIARRKNIGSARSQRFADNNSVIHSYASRFRQRSSWRHAHSQNYKFGFNELSRANINPILPNRTRRGVQKETDPRCSWRL